MDLNCHGSLNDDAGFQKVRGSQSAEWVKGGSECSNCSTEGSMYRYGPSDRVQKAPRVEQDKTSKLDEFGGRRGSVDVVV